MDACFRLIVDGESAPPVTRWGGTQALGSNVAQSSTEIFSSDQGSQFTSEAFTEPLLALGVQISMDGRGARRDNVFYNARRPHSSLDKKTPDEFYFATLTATGGCGLKEG